ncbi:daptide biosynthesis intramembrane metalloprotease [Paenarthrobacter sp. NPDC018779]|uniref:daptide biosynthesis intramembrane metalloprotease n=1 Tax=Paenarthrobacter sp. NPDC018779 TaxID=3364375 RepID=UPI0037CC0E36
MSPAKKLSTDPPVWPVQLAPAASIDPPVQDDAPWIVALNGVPRARVSGDVAAVLRTVDGVKGPEHVAEQLGEPWTARDVTGVVEQLAGTRIFDGGTHRAKVRWVQFRAPLTVQFTLFNPTVFLYSLRPVVAALVRREVLVLAALLVLGGMVGLSTAGHEILRVLSTPLPLEAYLGVAAAMFASTLLHELGHGLALAYFGGQPRRIGIMLFYLSPAFFCDVTDGWRLPSRKQRVLVALAGPMVHLGLGSAALSLQGFMTASTAKDGVLLYGVLCYCVAVLNLFPFIKLDGYVALMSALDVPYLRRKSMDAMGDLVRVHVFGARHSLPKRGLLPWFGLASFVAGLAFMAIGFQRLVPVFLQFGFAGHLVVAAVLLLLLALVSASIVRFFLAAARNGSPLWRRVLVGAAGMGVLAVILAAVPVTSSQVAGYTLVNGRLNIVIPVGSTLAKLAEGDRVSLQSQGLVIHRELGMATIGSLPPSLSKAPLEALVPVTFGGLAVPALSYDADVRASGYLPSSGRAEITSHVQLSLGAWLWKAISTSPLWPGD